jgi:uncharacterized protein YceK
VKRGVLPKYRMRNFSRKDDLSNPLIKVCNVLALAVLVFCPGCMAVLGRGMCNRAGPQDAYRGVRTDVALIAKGDVVFILDLPFSAVCDTLLLPSDLTGPRPPRPHPLEGWLLRVRLDELRMPLKRSLRYKPDPAILEDLQKYISSRKFPNAPSDTDITFWEDIMTRRHAVRIVVSDGGKQIHHILIYDTSNRRTKTIKLKSDSPTSDLLAGPK